MTYAIMQVLHNSITPIKGKYYANLYSPLFPLLGELCRNNVELYDWSGLHIEAHFFIV